MELSKLRRFFVVQYTSEGIDTAKYRGSHNKVFNGS